MVLDRAGPGVTARVFGSVLMTCPSGRRPPRPAVRPNALSMESLRVPYFFYLTVESFDPPRQNGRSEGRYVEAQMQVAVR
jgi:hypothetical protein